MEIFAGKRLLDIEGREVYPSSALNNKVVGLFFSAGWCPPCRRFLPLLVDFYQGLVDAKSPLEIVFISSDATVEDMNEYRHHHGNWLALPHSDPFGKQLKRKYSVQTLPKFIVIAPNGEAVTTRGRVEVTESGTACFDGWLQACAGLFDKGKSEDCVGLESNSGLDFQKDRQT